ncbi:MAG: biosynthetic peptidoglycan transglycosylase, partial [Caldimonas sp.]
SQQLAKLLYTGDERSAARKVRELLYAVELDRTLGKARVLQLYLAVVPWGDGQCGGEAAALHYFGKHATALDAAEAVWLASLLRNPEAELDRAANGVDRVRLTALADALRPMARVRREDLKYELTGWSPPPIVLLRAERPAITLAASAPERESPGTTKPHRSALRSPG